MLGAAFIIAGIVCHYLGRDVRDIDAAFFLAVPCSSLLVATGLALLLAA